MKLHALGSRHRVHQAMELGLLPSDLRWRAIGDGLGSGLEVRRQIAWSDAALRLWML